jgi:alpha-N-arabinofuranosidase
MSSRKDIRERPSTRLDLRPLIAGVLAAVITAAHPALADEPKPIDITIRAESLHAGRISPLLFGNFIELLDDVVPGMWAEMLNDRSFEGVAPLSSPFYFDGTPDICDRPWDPNSTWSYDHEQPYNGAGCAKLTATHESPATLTQSGLAVKLGMTYHFSGYFRASSPRLAVSVSLKTLLPDGSWMTLASAALPEVSDSWRKLSATMTARGQTDRVVFELKIEGQGNLWADKLSLMPADNVHGWRRDVVDLVKDLRPPVIRWGGSIIDPGGYQWKNGIGNRDARTPFRNQIWGRIDPNDVGIDEFCQFCEAVRAEPLVCVSLADGPQSAGDLVQYCNGNTNSTWGAKRAANGHPAPYHVRYWQVGNEIAGDKPAYLDHIEDFVHQIKQADPGVQVMSSYPAQKLLDVAGKDLAFVCPHQYTRDLAACDSSLSALSEMINTTPGCSHLKIGITEWNVSGGDWGLGRSRQMSLETALFNARHLHVMMRHCDKVEIATRSNMANSFCGATFETNPAGILKRPSHYVMDLYTQHSRPVPLEVQSEGGLDIFACASTDKTSITLFAVNTEGSPQPVHITSQGFGKSLYLRGAQTVCDIKDARQIDVMNHWIAPDRVKTVNLEVNGDTLVLPALSATAIECETGQ